MDKNLKNRTVKIITQCYCPTEFGIEGRCSTGECSILIMSECWKETLTKYKINFGPRPKFKNKISEYSYDFEPIKITYEKELELICINDDCYSELVKGNTYVAIGEDTGRYILKDNEEEYLKTYFETKDSIMDELDVYTEKGLENMISEYIDLTKVTKYEDIPKILKNQGLELVCIVQTCTEKRKYCIREILSKNIEKFFIV